MLLRWSPWAAGDTVRWLVFLTVGHAAWLAGWWGASREPGFNDQFPWAALSAAGLLLVAYGHVHWVLLARARIAGRRRARWPEDRWEQGLASVAADPAAGALVVAGPGTAHFHRPDCQFVAGKRWPELARPAAEAEGRAPCGACRP